MNLKILIRSYIPEPLIGFYHLSLSFVANLFYGRPSEKMIVIGVTGTNGKSSVVGFIGQLLQYAGKNVGWMSTATIHDGKSEKLNDTKMTMLGRFQLQKYLSLMQKNGCEFAIVETSSEGIKQERHRGINYDVAVFTNLTPEHIESHGGFENYKKAKQELFAHFSKSKRKIIQGHSIPKITVVNGDDRHAQDFLCFPADKKNIFTVDCNVEETEQGLEFRALGMDIKVPLLGRFNVSNVLASISVVKEFGLSAPVIQNGVAHLHGIPGRLEKINEGQPFTIIVDYSPDPDSMQKLYDLVVSKIKKNRIIHVFGSAGGGRDKARRPKLGRIAGLHADICIITNEDPYDENPREIMEQVAKGAREAGKQDQKDLFVIEDRGEAIQKALELALPGDLILITGKACEQAICVANGKKIPWDDREVVRKKLQLLKKT